MIYKSITGFNSLKIGAIYYVKMNFDEIKIYIIHT